MIYKKTWHQTLNTMEMKCGRDQQPTYEKGTKTTMVMIKNNKSGIIIR